MVTSKLAASASRYVLSVLVALFLSVTMAQAERVEQQAQERAIVELWEALLPLKSVNSFMNTGAHPDDERSSLLAYLSKGLGARVISVTANRGEGGQNAIGTEYQDALGIVRSREMEEASRAYGVDLYFLSERFGSPIYDFGFSKTSEETFSEWGRQETLRRLVRAIRESRPDVVFTSFLDVYGQHGHHRAMNVATREAFDLAADPNAFPEQLEAGLRPWRIKKFYLPAESGAGSTYADDEPPPPVTLTVALGNYDPIFGATYEQLGEQSRVFHKSQGMGSWHPEEPSTASLHLLRSRVNKRAEDRAIFGGLPNTVGELADTVSDTELAETLLSAQEGIAGALDSYPKYAEVATNLQRALTSLRTARTHLPEASLGEAQRFDLDFRLGNKEAQLQNALQQAALLVTRLEAVTEEDSDANPYELTRGSTTNVTLTAYRGGPVALENVTFELVVPEGWQTERQEAGQETTLDRGQMASATFTVTAPDDAPYSQPYKGHVSPYTPKSEVYGVVRYEVDGVAAEVLVAPEENLAVLPDLSLEASTSGMIFNTVQPDKTIAVDVTATNNVAGAADATLSLAAPQGWQVEPSQVQLSFSAAGEAQGATFTVTVPDDLAPDSYTLELRAKGDAASQQVVQRISYPHIGTNYMVAPAQIVVQAFPVEVSQDLRIGYVAGGSDTVDEALAKLGVQVELLDESTLTAGDLSVYDTIVVGVYAYAARPDLAAANNRLLSYVENGGNLVVQYHRPSDNWNPETTAPYFLELGSPSFLWRVTDETAEVTYLEPDHPLVNVPNKITEADWEGWIKDRGLYFPSDWADEYTPLFSLQDPGEEPFRSSLLTTRYGEGRYTYTSLIYYFELENLVPGAYRMFANFITPPQ